MTEVQKKAGLGRRVECRDCGRGHIYFLAKIFATDGTSFLQAASVMAGLSVEEYSAKMLAGGRSPEGQRSIRERLRWLGSPSGRYQPRSGHRCRDRPWTDQQRVLEIDNWMATSGPRSGSPRSNRTCCS